MRTLRPAAPESNEEIAIVGLGDQSPVHVDHVAALEVVGIENRLQAGFRRVGSRAAVGIAADRRTERVAVGGAVVDVKRTSRSSSCAR
jgi:hypothetical protein